MGMEPATVAEMNQRAQEHAAAMDLDKDGYITAAETRAFREQQREARAAAKFARMDTDKDGRVSIAEFTAEHTAKIQATARSSVPKCAPVIATGGIMVRVVRKPRQAEPGHGTIRARERARMP